DPRQMIGPELDRLAGGGIDDARNAGRGDVARERGPFFGAAATGLDSEGQVGALESGDELERFEESELCRDVGANVGRGGGREGRRRNLQRGAYPGEPAVVRPEIVAPLADAMRLVNHEARGSGAQ